MNELTRFVNKVIFFYHKILVLPRVESTLGTPKSYIVIINVHDP